MSQYFPKSYECSGGNVKVELNLSNFATKEDFKTAAEFDTSNLTAKSASLKVEVDKIDMDKTKAVPANLSKLSNAVDNDFVKKLCVIS